MRKKLTILNFNTENNRCRNKNLLTFEISQGWNGEKKDLDDFLIYLTKNNRKKLYYEKKNIKKGNIY